MFASNRGAVTALALVAAYPEDVLTLVAHEPPLIPVLPDSAGAERTRAAVRDARTAVARAELLGEQATVFPSHHGGFLGGESGYAGQPEAFARKLRDMLDDNH